MKMRFSLFLCLFPVTQWLHAQDSGSYICLDQVGFYPGAPKIAIITGNLHKTSFYVIRENSCDTVFRGVLSELRHSLNSSLRTRAADFSALKQSRTFRLAVAGRCQSYVFRIEKNVHQPVAVAS